MKKQSIFFSLLAMILTLSVSNLNTREAHAQTQTVEFTDYSVLPENVSSPPDTIPNVLIVLDNSASMRNFEGTKDRNGDGDTNDAVDKNRMVGGHHPRSRSYIARKILRDIVSDPQNLGKMNIGFMEFDVDYKLVSGDNSLVAIEDCGDLSPPDYTENANKLPTPTNRITEHIKTPIIKNCDTSDTPSYRLYESTTADSARGRLRENVSLLNEDKVNRMLVALRNEPEYPDVKCNNTNSQTTRQNGIKTCIKDHYDFNATENFIGLNDIGNGLFHFDDSGNPTLVPPFDEDFRIINPSFKGVYGFKKNLFNPADIDGNGIPDMVEDPDFPSITAFGTPTFGSLVSAHNYLRGSYTASDPEPKTTGFLATLLPDGVTPITPLGSATTVTNLDCAAPNYILLITDGDPFNNINGDTITSVTEETCADINGVYQCPNTVNSNKRVSHTKSSIAPLLALMREGYKANITHTTTGNGFSLSPEAGYAPIETLVFGFGADGLKADGKEMIQLMANAGSFQPDANGEPTTTPRAPFLSNNADELKSQLQSVFQEITATSGSSSGISVVSSSNGSAGSLVQALYNPNITGTVTDSDNNTSEVSVAWTSTLSSYFLDEYGYLREDNQEDGKGTKGKLDGYDVDRAFELAFDPIKEQVFAQRFAISNIGTTNFTQTDAGDPIDLALLNPIWEAADVLGQAYAEAADAAARAKIAKTLGEINRNYTTPSSLTDGYRTIYSSIGGKQIEFIYDADSSTSDTINESNFNWLGVSTKEEAERIVRFIRGEEDITGFRNRSIGNTVYLLGDIVHSTAVQVDAPSEGYDTRDNDDSYTAFRDAYKYRRRMVYVGSNGGLLHAFNGGFWNASASEFKRTAGDIGCTSKCDNVDHELGAEIWAYAPMNLLPHLQFLTRKDYNSSFHVAYVDGAVKTFDVKAFNPDSTHVNGWGTILVAGMRLGGGEFTIDNNTARSAYIVFDVTDPKKEPKLIAEITHENLGFTTGEPTVTRNGDDWYLVFGSGPTEIQTATSDQQARLFRYKLNGTPGFDPNYDGTSTIASADPLSFVGDLQRHDWDGDSNHETVYFGTIGNADPNGQNYDAADHDNNITGDVFRYVSRTGTDPSSVDKLMDVGRAVPYKPLLKRFSGKNWVFFGTGRYFTADDSSSNEKNTYYGVHELGDTDQDKHYDIIGIGSLINVTDAVVDKDGGLSGVTAPAALTSTIFNSFDDVKTEILSNSEVHGWYSNFETNNQDPSRKLSATALSFRNLLFFTEYEPAISDGNQCTNEFGSSYLNVVDLTTGTAAFTAGFDGPLGLDGDNLTKQSKIGDGFAHQSYLFIGPDRESGKNTILIKTPLSTGAIPDTPINIPPRPSGRTSWREMEIQ